MSADLGGIRATQDKERAQEVWTGRQEREVCSGRSWSWMASSQEGIWTNGRVKNHWGVELVGGVLGGIKEKMV